MERRGRLKILFALFIAACALESFAITKIACIGNSITFGYGLSNQSAQSYPGKLQTLLGKTNFTVQNDGVNSTTMTKKGDVPYWKNGLLSQVFAFQPNIITIKLGTNDTKPQNWNSLGYGSQYKTDYLAMIDTLRAMASKPTIYLVLPVPVFSNATATSWGIRDSVIQKEMVIIKDIAAARTLTVIDANTPLKNFQKYFAIDGVHPDSSGEDTIAHVIFRALKTTAVKASAFRPRSAFFLTTENRGGLVVSLSVKNLSSIELFDISGKRLNACTNGHTLKTGSLNPGVYILRASK